MPGSLQKSVVLLDRANSSRRDTDRRTGSIVFLIKILHRNQNFPPEIRIVLRIVFVRSANNPDGNLSDQKIEIESRCARCLGIDATRFGGECFCRKHLAFEHGALGIAANRRGVSGPGMYVNGSRDRTIFFETAASSDMTRGNGESAPRLAGNQHGNTRDWLAGEVLQEKVLQMAGTECRCDYTSLEWGNAPDEAVDIIKEIIKTHGVRQYAKQGQLIAGEAFLSNVFWVDSGVLLLRLNPQYSIGSFGRDRMVGVNNIFRGSMTGHYLEAVEDTHYTACAVEHFCNKLDDGRLALAVAEHVNWQAMIMAVYVSVILKENAYGKVKFALELLNRASLNFRDHVSVVKFVCERTGVSKAHAHAILKQLRIGGYIEMTSGSLVRIFKTLPDAY